MDRQTTIERLAVMAWNLDGERQDTVLSAIELLQEQEDKRSMTGEEEFREMCRSNYAAQMAGLGYGPDGMALPKKDKSEWVSVKDRLPESSGMVICFDMAHIFYVVNYSVKHKKFNAYDIVDGDFYALETVTHWMPLPEPPKEE